MPSPRPAEQPAVDSALRRLAEGAHRHASRGAADRGRLAVEAARAAAAVAVPWAESAVAMKQRVEPGGRGTGGTATVAGAVLAEELATGPMATLRLLAVTARALSDAASGGLPRLAARPRRAIPDRSGGRGHGGLDEFVEVDVLPSGVAELHDATVFRGYRGTVRCDAGGDLAAFDRAWRREFETRPATGGVAVVLGAGNVTGLAVADAVSQIFEHGRAVLVKLHPLHAPLESLLREALAPLVAADLLELVVGGAEVAQAAVAAAQVTHVHLTGGDAAYDALVWGGPRQGRAADARPVLAKPITCELGNVTPWIVVPGRYTRRQLECQADMVAASIVNNTSFNCIATKLVITCRSWDQREAFLQHVQRRLAEQPARRAWYPGATAAWETLAERQAPADGTLPGVFRTGLDPVRDARWTEREWFVPCAGEIPLEADSVASFCDLAGEQAGRMPGSLAASVTLPDGGDAAARRRQEMLLNELSYGVVAVNCWSALAYAVGSIPWGGFPGATLAEPASGLGRVHDPLLLPLVHNAILRGPLACWPKPAWFAWNRRAAPLARGAIDLYARAAAGRATMPTLLRLLPDVLSG